MSGYHVPSSNGYRRVRRLPMRFQGMYTRIVIKDFLPHYSGRAPFPPGLSENGATKSWTGSPRASLQRAVLMLWKGNLHRILGKIRDALQQSQDVNSKELDLDGSDMSSQGSTEPSKPEESEINEQRGGRGEDKRRGPRAKSQQSGPGQRAASEKNKQDDKEDIVNEDGGGTRMSEDKGHSRRIKKWHFRSQG